jgi:WD40 repeat protein
MVSRFISVLAAVLVVAVPALATPTVRASWRPKEGGITALSIRPDGKQIAIGTHSGMLKVKDIAGGETGGTTLRDTAGWLVYGPLVYNSHPHGAEKGHGSLVAISPGGRFSVFYTDTYENQTESDIGPLHGTENPLGALSGDGRYLAFSKGGADLWIGRPAEWRRPDWNSPKTDWSSIVMRRPEGVVGNVVSLALNGDGSLLVAAYHTAEDKGALVLFNRRTGRSLQIRHVDFPPTAVAYSPRGKWLAAVGRGHVWLGSQKAENGKVLPAPPSPAASVAFSPDEKTLAVGCEDGTVYLWEVSTHRARSNWKAHQGRVSSIAWGPDGRMLATGGADGRVQVWDLR